MSEAESGSLAEWLAGAERDLKSARILFAGSDDLLGAAGLFLYQALQKFLTGYLLSHSSEQLPPDELFELLDAAMAYDRGFADFATMCVQVTDFYFDHRASSRRLTSATRTKLQGLFAEAERLIARVRSQTTPASPPA
ncbi:MAG: HEPN domain-containing protein [Anaerolineales bacterium]